MRAGIFLAPVRETPGHVALAEELGFASAWCDDSPLLYHEGEPLDSPRLRAAVGPVVAVAFHAFAEQPWRLAGLDPALREQAAADVDEVSAALPPERRHQELHRATWSS